MLEDPRDRPGPLRQAYIRAAHVEEAAALSELAVRSKAHWGYDAAFIDACREDLTITGDDIGRGSVFVLDADECPIGFYTLHGSGDEAILGDLFVEPDLIGRGHGRLLWAHARETARRMGYTAMIVHSDPHAGGFYLAMGAARLGGVPSTVSPGRVLPLMRVALGSS